MLEYFNEVAEIRPDCTGCCFVRGSQDNEGSSCHASIFKAAYDHPNCGAHDTIYEAKSDEAIAILAKLKLGIKI